MKTLLYSIGATLLLLACHKSNVFPNGDPLYQRWRLTSSTDTYISFLPDGIILYGADGTLGTCCEPRTFVRQDSVLYFRNVPSKEIPVFVKKVDCSTVFCAVPDSWTIVTLTTAKLVLKTPYGTQTYQAN